MSRSRSARWYAALAALIVFVLLAWLLGAVLPLTDGQRVVLQVALVVLGLVTAAALLWYLRPGQAAIVTAADDRARDDALVAIDAARQRLPRGAFDAKPIVLVLGTDGSCKTTVVTRAALDAELLAGEAPTTPADAPPPTPDANVWMTRDAVLVEAGGPVFADATRWQRFTRALRAPRVGAALGRGAPPPRAAIVCVSCDLFYDGAAGATLDALAQLARQRLADAARALGQSVPVYVVFTKADRIPSFEAWVAPFARDEIREPLGAAVALDDATGAAAAGSHGERMVPRLERAFAELTTSVASRRTELLGRESTEARRLVAYELPRDLAKLAPAATRFLVELCRPTQIGAAPRLRGFYFVGARPVVLSDAAAPAAPAAAAAPPPFGGNATSAFQRPNVGLAAQAAAYAPPSARRVPQWTFLDRLVPDVVLADPAAPALAGGGARVAGLRRALLGTGIAASLIVAGGVLWSWIGNRSLTVQTRSAAAAVAALPVVTAPPGTIAFPSRDALRTLDALRAVLDTLRGYERDVPLRLRWTLWRGDALRAEATGVWLDGYRKQLHDVAWSALVDTLRALPDAPRPTDDYGADYAALKAYLIMTSESTRSTPSFLAPVLLRAWQRGQPTDADITALASRQFEFYAQELARANPWPADADAAVVSRTRDFLGRFAGEERIYQFMLAEADKAAKPARLTDLAPQAAGVVATAADVPGSFTGEGWRFMQDAFRNSDRFFQGERWVLGDAGAALAEGRDNVLASLRARYRDDYVQRWRAYVSGLAVARPSSAREAAMELGTLGSPQSPLLAALSLVARNTNVDSSMGAAFQPVHVVTAPTVLDKYVADANQPYVNALLALQGAVEQVANTPAAVDTQSAQQLAMVGQQALMQATQAKVAARQLAGKFNVDTAAARIGPAVAALLEAPAAGAEAVLRGAANTRAPAPRRVAGGGGGGGGGAPAAPATPAATKALTDAINERGRALCAAITPMLAKFPFNPDASAEATIGEVTAALAPGAGALWTLQQERLDGLIEKQGDQWVAKAGAPIALSAQFVAFFNRAARVSSALFGGGAEPRVVFHARGVPTDKVPVVILAQGTQVARFTANTPPNQFVWPSATGRDVVLSAEGNSRFLRGAKTRTIDRASGDWGIFRLVARAAKAEGGGAGLRAEWNGGDAGPIAVEFTFASGAPVLQRGWLGGWPVRSR